MQVFLLLLPVLASQLTQLASTSPPAPLVRDEVCSHAEPEGQGHSLLVLVNKDEDTRLDQDWSPDDMVAIPSHLMAPGSRGELRQEAAMALEQMLDAGRDQGHEIRVRSAYRSFAKQERIFHNKSRRYGHAQASRVSARAGHSQHQLGTTVDIVMPRYRNRITQRIARSPEWKWLDSNAHRFGFALSYPRDEEELTGYMYEPWHYRYLGVEAATEMWEHGVLMESYLQACSDSNQETRTGKVAHRTSADIPVGDSSPAMPLLALPLVALVLP